MAGLFSRLPTSNSGAVGGFNVTPSDTVGLPRPVRALQVGGAGTVAVIMSDGSAPTFTVPDGGWLYVQATRVLNTGTTATLIVGLY